MSGSRWVIGITLIAIGAFAGPVERFDCTIIGTSDYAAAADSDVVIITAGIPRKPGMSRDDLMQTNVNVQSLTVEAVLTGRSDHVLHAAMVTRP